MTREKAQEYLKGILGVEPTKEQIDNLLANVNKEDQERQKQIEDLTKQVNDLTKKNNKYSDYDDIKKQLDDINKAKMSKEEQLAEREKEIAKKEQKTNRRDNRSIIKEIVSGLNISDDVIDSLVSDDANVSRKNAENLVAQINTIKETTIKETKESLINVDVKPDVKDAVPQVTKRWNDLSYNEKLEMKRNNPQEYELLKQTKQD